jgi:hypothetical protein
MVVRWLEQFLSMTSPSCFLSKSHFARQFAQDADIRQEIFGRHEIQHNDTQHNDIQHNNEQNVTLSIWLGIVLLSVKYELFMLSALNAECCYAKCHYAECRGANVLITLQPL